MFDQIKSEVSLLEKLEKDLSVTFKSSGEKNWVIEGKEFEECPFCSHHDCFRVCYEPDNRANSFYKCFSCGEYGDVITWVSKRKKLTMGDAAKDLIKEYDLKIQIGSNPIQEIFTAAAVYYHACLVETCNRPYPILNGLTPFRYQTEVRKRRPETLEKFNIGFSDGGLVTHLNSLGFDEELIKKSGLSKDGKDFLPANCFIYPHYVKGRVSHFTFKDPLKRIQYQLPKKYNLNGYVFYGQDTFQSAPVVFLVEGENDLLAVWESGQVSAVMAIIGQISGEQIEWLKSNCKNKAVITVFDPDEAGDKYRSTVEEIKKHIGALKHVRPRDDKDIDEHLINGADFSEIVKTCQVVVEPKSQLKISEKDKQWLNLVGPIALPRDNTTKALETSRSDSSHPGDTRVAESKKEGSEGLKTESASRDSENLVEGLRARVASEFEQENSDSEKTEETDSDIGLEDDNVKEDGGCYWRIKYTKDKNEEFKTELIRLSNFVVEMKNVYVYDDGDRKREIVLVRRDGRRSEVLLVDAETKVTARLFRILAAKAGEFEWMGKDNDLDAVWRLIFKKNPEIVIRTMSGVGRFEKEKFWVFKNLLITDSGTIIKPDSNGVFWINGRTLGVKLDSITDSKEIDGIPKINTELTEEEADQKLKEGLEGMAKIFNNPGPALLAVGWAQSNLYSNKIFETNGGMGILMFWGMGGQGKSTMCKWLQRFYGLEDKMASTNVHQLRTIAGFMRKGEYYASLPLFIDELRDDEQSNNLLGIIRSWYDREGRTLAEGSGKNVRNQSIKGNLMIAGEDLPADPATRERCVMIRVPKLGDETKEIRKLNFNHMEENVTKSFSGIAYHWLREFTNSNPEEIMKGIREIDYKLVSIGCSNRISKVWAGAAYFGNKLAEKFFPDYDFMGYTVRESAEEQKQQKNDNMLYKFFNQIPALQVREHSRINENHLVREGSVLHLWLPAIYKEVMDNVRGKDTVWSRPAILRALREEPYFISDDKKVSLGLSSGSSVRRTVISLDLTKAPDIVREIAKYDPEYDK